MSLEQLVLPVVNGLLLAAQELCLDVANEALHRHLVGGLQVHAAPGEGGVLVAAEHRKPPKVHARHRLHDHRVEDRHWNGHLVREVHEAEGPLECVVLAGVGAVASVVVEEEVEDRDVDLRVLGLNVEAEGVEHPALHAAHRRCHGVVGVARLRLPADAACARGGGGHGHEEGGLANGLAQAAQERAQGAERLLCLGGHQEAGGREDHAVRELEAGHVVARPVAHCLRFCAARVAVALHEDHRSLHRVPRQLAQLAGALDELEAALQRGLGAGLLGRRLLLFPPALGRIG
mmetsp:Transcript_2113/g.7663  ORF Transcript_2113/g.7663 Transcript_2113/m.7663 type:complete len:290 (+) Transcript_2113:1060-1929(+)